MSRPAILVENLSKLYRLGASTQRPTSLREAVTSAIASPLRRFREQGEIERDASQSFWALRDVSFEVQPGEVVGIIGRNGAGKSTLLKILSRIVEPTEGLIRIRGRVASLLEVGTGFHPELTGRENVFLNGSILGMKRAEIARKFDEIVDFANLEQFIDTPVKRYSSGMYVRLAFAVAAHLEPEILIVDEVLAVGDAEFQNKCLAKMQKIVREEGRTILFVSHTMAAVEALCSRALYLDRGKVSYAGPTHDVITHYLALTQRDPGELGSLAEHPDRVGNGKVRFTSFHIEDEAGNRVQRVASGRDVRFVFGYEAKPEAIGSSIDIGFSVHSVYDHALFVLYNSYTDDVISIDRPTGHVRCTIPRLPLSQGRYRVGTRMLVDGEVSDWPQGLIGTFEVEAGNFYGSGKRGSEGNTSFLVSGSWAAR